MFWLVSKTFLPMPRPFLPWVWKPLICFLSVKYKFLKLTANPTLQKRSLWWDFYNISFRNPRAPSAWKIYPGVKGEEEKWCTHYLKSCFVRNEGLKIDQFIIEVQYIVTDYAENDWGCTVHTLLINGAALKTAGKSSSGWKHTYLSLNILKYTYCVCIIYIQWISNIFMWF